MRSEASSDLRTERTIIALISAVQFINILEFMMVMPLGPDFAKTLGIPTAHLGYIGGVYTAAASISGLAGAFFLERFDRRKALAVAMIGLVVATLAGGLATSFATLMLARVLAGVFGGPASALSLAIIADQVPPERRGKAIGTVMGAFSLASVFGVPAGLELARLGSWRTPFFCVAVLGVVIAGFAIFKLPSMTRHIEAAQGRPPLPLRELFGRKLVLTSYAMTCVVMTSGFMLIPNLSAYFQENLGYPRQRLGILYMVGGVLSFIAMRLVGRWTDRYGSFRIGTLGSLLMAVIVYFGFVGYVPIIPVIAIFVGFMVTSSIRNVPYNALATKVPRPHERARFMSIQSSVQHMSAALGAFVGAQILVENADHTLGNIDTLGWLSIIIGLTLPFMLYVVEKSVKAGSSQPQPQGG